MGIVICIEAAVCIAEAVEVAASAAAEVAVDVAVEAGAEAGAEAAEGAIEAGAEAGGEAGEESASEAAEAVEEGEGEEGEGSEKIERVVQKLKQAVKKVLKMAKEYMEMDSVFRVAKKILKAITADPAAQERARKLDVYIKVLNDSSTTIKNIADWLQKNSDDAVKLKSGFTVSIQGILSKFIPKLGAAAGVLKHLSTKVGEQNDKKLPITDTLVGAIGKGLQTVVATLGSLADFKNQHDKNVPLLKDLPISEVVVMSLSVVLDTAEINLTY